MLHRSTVEYQVEKGRSGKSNGVSGVGPRYLSVGLVQPRDFGYSITEPSYTIK
jgi:hypothetical protein